MGDNQNQRIPYDPYSKKRVLFLIPLVALGISPTTVRNKIRTANLDMPWDKIESDEIGATVRLYGRFRDIKDLGQLPVSRLNAGRVVRLDEIGDVHRDLEREKAGVSVSWTGSAFAPSVDISVMKVPGVDTLKTIDRIKSTLKEEFDGPGVPYGLNYSITSDQSEFIWEKLHDVFNNGWQAMLCVFVVLSFIMALFVDIPLSRAVFRNVKKRFPQEPNRPTHRKRIETVVPLEPDGNRSKQMDGPGGLRGSRRQFWCCRSWAWGFYPARFTPKGTDGT